MEIETASHENTFNVVDNYRRFSLNDKGEKFKCQRQTWKDLNGKKRLAAQQVDELIDFPTPNVNFHQKSSAWFVCLSLTLRFYVITNVALSLLLLLLLFFPKVRFAFARTQETPPHRARETQNISSLDMQEHEENKW